MSGTAQPDFSSLADQIRNAGTITVNPAAAKAGPQSSSPDFSGLADQIRTGAPSSYQGQDMTSGGGQSQPMVNPSASNEDLIRSFGFDPDVIQKSPRFQADMKNYGSLGGVLTATRTPLEKYANKPGVAQFSDIDQGVEDALSGVIQLARHGAGKLGMLSDADVQYGDLLDRLGNQDYLENVRKGQAGQGLIHLGQWLFPVPGAGKAKTVLGAIARGGLHGATAGAEIPVESGAPDDFGSQKLSQVATGGIIGATVPAITAGFINPWRVTFPETAAADTAAKFRNVMETTPFNSLQSVQQAANAGDKQASQVLESINKAGQTKTPGDITQASIQLQNYLTGQQAEGLYGDIDQLLSKYRLGPAPLSGTQRALNAAEREARVGLKDRGLNTMLQDVRDALTPPQPAASAPSGLVTPSGQPVTPAATPPPTMQARYATARKVISQLDEAIREGHTGDGALISDRGTGQLQQVKNALENDLQTFVSNSGRQDLQQAQQAADDYYRTVRVPFKDLQIAKAGSTDQSSQIWKRFIQAGNPDKAQKLYDALDPKGRAGLQYQMLNDQLQKATDPVTGFDAGKFSRSMNKLQDAYGVAFTGQDKVAVDGMRNLVLQAAKFEANPASAFGKLLPLSGAAATMVPRSEKVLHYMMSVPIGRRFLYLAAGLKPGTPQMQNILSQVEAAAAKWATATATGTGVQ